MMITTPAPSFGTQQHYLFPLLISNRFAQKDHMFHRFSKLTRVSSALRFHFIAHGQRRSQWQCIY
jgi:hypothetical protein